MSSLTLGMAWLFEWMLMVRAATVSVDLNAISWIAFGITVFAFLLSLIREIIKDWKTSKATASLVAGQSPSLKVFVYDPSGGDPVNDPVHIVIGQPDIPDPSWNARGCWWLAFAVEIPSGFFLYYLLHATASRTIIGSAVCSVDHGRRNSLHGGNWLSFRF
jgi:hypothetical protein